MDDDGGNWHEHDPEVKDEEKKDFAVIKIIDESTFFFWRYTVRYNVRISNELGGEHPRTAKFSLVVAVGCHSL